ncbi:MAG: metal ABC transporter solute-binding protein, Zn/Mn family [Candidatus Hodarchaeota archaeon]
MEKHQIRIISVLMVVVFATVILVAPYLGHQSNIDDERIGIVVTILPQAEFVEQIGKDKVQVTVLIPPGASPHTYEPTSSQLKDVSHAKMYAKVGSGVEFELVWMEKIIETNKEMLIVDCSKGIELREIEQHTHEEEHEHLHEGMDPHIWLSIRNAIKMVQNIRDGLTQINPANADFYEQNAASYLQSLIELDAEIQKNLADVKNRSFMVFHPAWGYFADDYGLEQIPIEVEGKEPSAQDLAYLIEKAEENNITVVFTSPQFNPKSAEVIAEGIGGHLVFIDPLARDYVTNMRIVADTLVYGMN